ncbi:MAG: DUF554 domain-containing protein [Oscillospiraceae bacterium]|nr:DUF554 domain-containing protein [Oscillospiraceae bacterium]
MFGVLVNTFTVILGSIIGLVCKKGIPERLSDGVMTGIGLCTIAIGVTGLSAGENTLVLILSMVIGVLLGTLLDLDGRLNRWVEKVAGKAAGAGKAGQISQGFLTACLLFCIGAMTIVGSLNAGLKGDNEMLLTKSLLDFISSIMLSATLGIGVLFSAVFVLVFQGGIVLLAQFLAPILSTSAIAEMSCAGSLMILALGLNIIGVTKIKVINFLPALVLVPVVVMLFGAAGIG